MNYTDCKVLCELKKKKTPLISKVPIDNFTEMVSSCFDFEFDGESKFFPYELPKEILDMNFNILCVVGGSGKGKSTLLKEFNGYNFASKKFDNSKAIVSNFNTEDEASHKLSAVGLNSLPVWCRPRNVLSVGEGFRADVALNLDDYTIFDEYTSTIDRNVAKSTSNGLQKYIRHNNIKKTCEFSINYNTDKYIIINSTDLWEQYKSRFANIIISWNNFINRYNTFTMPSWSTHRPRRIKFYTFFCFFPQCKI